MRGSFTFKYGRRGFWPSVSGSFTYGGRGVLSSVRGSFAYKYGGRGFGYQSGIHLHRSMKEAVLGHQ